MNVHFGFPGGTASQALAFLHNAYGAPFDIGGLAGGRSYIPNAVNIPSGCSRRARRRSSFERLVDVVDRRTTGRRQSVRLVVGDREFDAYLDEIADDRIAVPGDFAGMQAGLGL